MIWIFFFSNLKWDSKLTTSVKTLHFKKVYVYLELLFLLQVFFTAVDFAFDDFPWGDNLFAILLAAVRWSGTSFDKGFCCYAWDLSFYIHFSTTVLIVQTGYLFCTFFFLQSSQLLTDRNRNTSLAFQGITWKIETNTKIELIAWIWKAYTPNYPIVTIQYFCFSTRKPFGIKLILNLCPSPHFFRQAFLGEKRAKCYTNLKRTDTIQFRLRC